MPYHVCLTVRSARMSPEMRLDLGEAELEDRFLRPYREGRPITIGGKTIATEDIERLVSCAAS